MSLSAPQIRDTVSAAQRETDQRERSAWAEAAGLTVDAFAGLELEHNAAPGSVILSASSVSRDGDHVFEVRTAAGTRWCRSRT